MAGKKKTTYDDWLRANNSTFNKMADVIATAGDTMRSAVKGVEQRFRISKYNEPGFNPYQDYNTAVQYGRDLQSMYDSYKGQNLFANSLKAGQNPLGAYWQESRLKSAITRHNTYMDGVTDESSFNDRIAYPVRFSGLTSAAGVNAQLKGMQQTISGLRQSGDKKKAEALQAEYDWLTQHQYDYWAQTDFDAKIEELTGLADQARRNSVTHGNYEQTTTGLQRKRRYGTMYDTAIPTLAEKREQGDLDTEKQLRGQISELQAAKERNAYRDVFSNLSAEERNRVSDAAKTIARYGGWDYARRENLDSYKNAVKSLQNAGYSIEEADAIIRYATLDTTAMNRAEMLKGVSDWAGQNDFTKAIGSIASIPMSIQGGVGYLGMLADKFTSIGQTDPFTGDGFRVDTNAAATAMSDLSQALRGAASKDMSGFGRLVYNATMSFADSMLAMATGEWAGEAALGLSAATQATKDAYARGATDTQALVMGGMAGLAESLFEHISIDKLRIMRTSNAAARKTIREFALDWVKQSFTEASEEGATDIANLISDALVMGDKSELDTMIKQYRDSGMSESDATVQAWKDWGAQVFEDMAAGFLSGGMGTVVNTGIGKANNAAQQIKTGRAMQANAENISAITNGWLFPEGSATKSLADRLVQDIRDGKSPSAKQYGELAQAMEKDRSKGIDALSDVSATRLVARMNDDGGIEFVTVEGATAEALQKAGLSAADAVSQGLILDDLLAGRITESQMADLDVESEGVQQVFSDITGAELPTEAKRPALEKVFRSAAQQYAEQKAADTAALEEEGAALAEARAVFDNAVAENDASATLEAERIMTEAQDRVAAEAPVEAAEPARRAETREEFNARKQQEAQEQNGWTLTDDQLNDMWSNETGAIPFSDGGEVTRDEFFDEMREYYKADQGYTPTNDQLESLYQRARTAAVNGDVQLTREAWEASKSKSGTKESVGATPMGVTTKAEARMTEAAKLEQELSATLLQRALADRGVSKIVFSDDLPEEENGHINTKTGVITIRPDITTQRMIYWTVGHEIFHGAVTTDSDLVDRTIEVFQQLEKEGALGGQLGSSVAEIVRDIDAVVKDKQETYREFFKNKGMSEEEIAKLTTPERMKEEIAADLMGTALASEDILNRIAGVRPSLLTRVKQTIDRLFSSENLGDLLSDAKYKSARKEIDDLADRVNRALSDWSEQTDESSEDEDSNRYSIKTMFEGAGLKVDNSSGRLVVKDREGQTITKVMASDVEYSPYGALINYARDVSKTISKEDAMKQKGALASLLNLMMTSQDAQLVWRFSGAAMFSAIKANSDGQYGTTVDFSTVCRKTRQLVTAMSDVMKAQRRGLSRDKVVELQRDILEQGGEVNCPVCYVFSRWAGIGGILENMYRFQNRYGHEYDPTVNADGSLDWSKLDARIAELQAATKTKAALRKLLMEDTAETEYQDLARIIEETEAETKRLRELNKGYRTKAQKRDNAAQIAENKKAIEDNQKKVKEAKAAMQEIEKLGAPELSWLKNVRRHEHYWEAEKDSDGRVIGGGGYVSNPDVLFDLDAGDRFASQYPLAWAYRTGRGPSAGKAIQPYADMRIGDLILGPGKNRTKGEPNKAFANVESNTFNKAQMDLLEAAIARTKAQNLIGGQRFQSTSDFRYDYGLDYLQTFWEAQALGSTMQSYTKVLEFVTLAASVGGDVNISVMPLGKGYNDETGMLQFSDVTGVNYEDAVRLSEQYDSAQLILVGINDEHIRKALDDDGDAGGYYIGFVIPYHASGASISAFIATQLANITQVKNSPDTFNLGYYLDYAPIQTDSEKTKIDANDPRLEAIRRNPMNPRFTGSRPNATQLRELYQVYRRELRSAILTGKVHGRTGDAETLLQNAQEFLKAGKDNQTDLTGRSFEDLRAIELSALNGNEDALREYESWSDGVLYDIYNKMWVDESATDTYGVRLNSTQSKAIMPHEYWDTRTTRRTAFLNGLIFRSYCHNLGLTPRFTGIKSDGSRARATREVLDADGNPVLDAKGKPVTEKFEYGDFSDERGYWKTLIDRPMYNRGRDGTYRAQNKINATNVAMEMLSPQDGETFTADIAHNAAAAYLARNSTSVDDEGNPELVRYSLRTEPPPMKTQYGFKLMTVDENGRPHAMFIDAARPYELGVWYNADSPELKDLVKLEKNYAYEVDENGNVDEATRIPIRQVKKISEKTGKATWSWEGKPSKSVVQASDQAGKRWMAVVPANDGKGSDGKGTAVYNIGLNGSGTVSVFALRPGIHAVDIPSMAHIGMKSGETMKKNKDGKLTSVIDSRRPDQRWFLIEYPVDQDYNQEAYAHPDKDIKDHLPKDGWYSFQTNSGAEKRQHWFITGAMKIVGPVSEADVRSYARDHGFEEDLPWRQGKAYSDDDAIDLDEYIRTTDAQPTPSKREMGKRIRAEARGEKYSVLEDGMPKFSVGSSIADQIKAAQQNKMQRGQYVYYGTTTQKMRDVGFRDADDPILMSPSKIRIVTLPKSAADNGAHGITSEQLERIPYYLENPVMMIDSMSMGLNAEAEPTKNNSVIFVTDMLDGDGFPIVAAVNAYGDPSRKTWVDMDVGSAAKYFNEVKTVFGKGPVNSAMPRAITEGPGTTDTGHTFYDYMKQAMDNDAILYVSEDGVRNLLNASRQWVKEKNQPVTAQAGDVTPRGAERTDSAQSVSPAAAFVKRGDTWSPTGRKVYNNWVSFPKGFANIPRDVILHQSRNIMSPVDRKYMDAVENGNMESAQRMVDEAASNTRLGSPVTSGMLGEIDDDQIDTLEHQVEQLKDLDPERYSEKELERLEGKRAALSHQLEVLRDAKENGVTAPLVLYHGGGGRTVYDGRGKNWNGHQSAVYLTDSYNVAEAFAKGATVQSLYTYINNPLILDAEGRGYTDIPIPDDAQQSLKEFFWYDNTADADNLPTYAEQNGYDGVIIKNVREGVGGEPMTEVITLRPEQIKSADPVTYDNDGNIIPLSERFNPENEDIRYSVTAPKLPQRMIDEYDQATSKNDTEAAARILSKAALDAGAMRDPHDSSKPLVLYHGTRAFGFNRFDLGKMDDGSSIFLTDSLPVAASYSGTTSKRSPWAKASPKETVGKMSLQEVVDEFNELNPAYGRRALRVATTADIDKHIDKLMQTTRKCAAAAQNLIDTPDTLAEIYRFFNATDEQKSIFDLWLRTVAEFGEAESAADLRKAYDDFTKINDLVRDNTGNQRLYWILFQSVNASDLANAPRFAAFYKENRNAPGVWDGEYAFYHESQIRELLRRNLDEDVEEGAGNYKLFAFPEKTLHVDAAGNAWNDISFLPPDLKAVRSRMRKIEKAGGSASNNSEYASLEQEFWAKADEYAEKYDLSPVGFNTTRAIAAWAKDNGYDSVEFEDVIDVGEWAEDYFPSTVVAMFDPNRVKSAEPIIRGEDNKVIPIQERLDFNRDDIRYSLPGNSPLFDEYMRKLTGQDQAEHLADNPPKQTLSQTNSTNHLFNGNERRQKGIRAKDRTHTVVTDEAMDDIVSRRLTADAEAEKKDLFAPGRKWDATDLAVAEELIRREVEKGRANKNLDEAKRLLRLHDAQMSDWGLAGHTAGRFGSSKMGIVQDAVNTIDESSKNDEANKGKRKTATKVVKDIEGEAKDALGTITDELTGKKPVRRSGDKRRGDRTKDGRPTIPTKEDFDANENGPVRGINQKGEPFTFEYSRVVGEAIAKNIASRQKRDAKSKTFLQQLQAEMMRFAKETQSRRAPKSKPTTATALLRSYVENRKFFDEAWNAARDDLRSKFGDKIPADVQRFLRGWYGVSGDGAINSKIVQAAIVNSAMESKETTDMIRKQHALGVKDIGAVIAKDLIRRTKATGELADMINVSAQYYVDEVLSRPVNDKGTRVAFDAEQQKKMANRMVENALRDIGKQLELTTFGRLGSSSAKVKADLRDAVINTLTNKYGVADADASGVADVVGARFDALLREGMEKRLKSMFKERTPRDKAKQKSFLDRVIELTNLGALDNEAYHDAAISKLLDGYTTRRGVSADKVLGKVFDYATQLEEIEQGDTKELRKLINKLNAERWTGGMLKGDQINKILDTALKTVEKAPDGAEFLRDLAAAQIRGIAGDNAHITTVEALTSVRYLNMLSKLTTVMRNLAGNTAFDFAETLSNNIGVPIDMLLSLRTGRRTTTLDKSVFSSAKWKGMIDGAMRAYIETALDAPIEDGTNRWEVRNGRTFKMAKPVTGGPIRRSSNVLERFMSTMEKWQRYLLTVSDEFYKGGVRAETQRGIDKLKAAGKLEQDALEDWAMQTALERTFQNEGLLSQGLGKIREGFNYAGVKDYKGNRFGLGTMAAPFLGVPANIAAQIGNYSIPGATRAIVELGNVIRLGNKATAEQQARAVRDAGRALNGMTFMSLLVAAALKGILHVAGLSGDDDEAALERDEGLIGMQLNWSALERAVKGKSTEYRPDDTLVNVGALEPMNGSMTFAAMLAEAIKDSVDDPNNTGYFKLTRKALKEAKKNPSELIEANFHALVQALQDLPALSTITRTYDAYKYSDEKYDPETNPEGNDWKRALDAGAQFIGDVAASVAVPNLLSGIAAGRDEGKVRTTQSQDKRGLAAVPEEVLNAIKAKIPGLRETLPQAVGSWGEGRQTTATKGENWMNSNILPFAVTHYKPDPVTEELKSLRESGEKVTMPKRNAPFNLKTEDGKVKLSDEERREYQTIMGREAHSSMLEAMRDEDYTSASESTRANVWANLSSYATAKAKKESGGEASKPDWVGKYGDAAPDEWWTDDTPVSSAIAAAWWKTARGAIDKEGTLTNGEKIQAVNSTDMTPEMADTLLTQQLSEAAMTKYRGAVRLGISPELYAQILADTTDEKMPANGVRGGHKAKVKAYLESLVQQRIITQAQMDYLMTLELG